MTGLWIIDLLCLLVILTSAVLVVTLHNRIASVITLSAMGTTLGLLFVVLGAPDVAHAEIVVGSIATPVLYLIAISKVRADIPADQEFGEPAASDD